MAQIVQTLSGVGGLARGFHGNPDEITPRPERMVDVEDGQMAMGLFNPHLREGYLAPVTNVETSLTLPGSLSTLLTSVEYDHLNDDVYLANRSNSLFGISSLGGETVTSIADIEGATYTEQGFESIHDLNIYEKDGDRSLFIVGKGIPIASGPSEILGTQDSNGAYISGVISVPPHATTTPSVVASYRSATSASSNTIEISGLTVPSGTNQSLVVVVMWTSNLGIASTATWGGTSMISVIKSQNGPSIAVYELKNPTAGTNTFQATFNSSTTIFRCAHAFVLDNVSQTLNTEANQIRQTTAISNPYTVTIEPDWISRYQKTLITVLSQTATEISVPDTDYTELDFDTNSYGYDGVWESAKSGYGLLISSSTLPTTSVVGPQSSWFPSIVAGGFLQPIDTDYAFMRNADNGFSYIFADNKVHKVDGSITGGDEGLVTKDVLLFPDYFTITDAVDYRSSLFIAVHLYPVTVASTVRRNFTGKCGIYVWNRISTQLSSSDYIELPGVREIKKIYISPDQVLKLIVITDGGLVEIREFGYNDSGGVIYRTVHTLGVGAFPQFPDGHTVAGDKSIWLANDGNIYCEKGQALTKLYEVKAKSATETGTIDNIDSGIVLYGANTETSSSGFRDTKQAITFSYIDTDDFVSKIYPFDLTNGSNATQTPHVGKVFSGVKYIPITSIVRRVRIYNAPVSSTGSTVIATVKVYFNQSSTAGITKSITLDEAKRGYVDFNISKSYIHAVQLEFEWATGTPIGEDMYLPSVAIISTEDTAVTGPDNT